MPIEIDCFKAYDIRGRIPDQLNVDIAYRIGNATTEFLEAEKIVLGRDIRLSSKELSDAVAKGVTDAGAEVMDIGLGGTEMVYFATSYLEADGGISHIDNGLFCRLVILQHMVLRYRHVLGEQERQDYQLLWSVLQEYQVCDRLSLGHFLQMQIEKVLDRPKVLLPLQLFQR